MSTDPPVEVRRLALVVASHSAAAATPPGIHAPAFAECCLADSHEVLADLVGVSSGIVGDKGTLDDLLGPGAVGLSKMSGSRAIARAVADRASELVLMPGDVPDLPGLVVAKVFKALQRAEVCVAPERGGDGCAAFGVRLPWPDWLNDDLDLDVNPLARLRALAPERARVAVGPDWHRMRTRVSSARLDPGLEGWEMTRALLSGAALVQP